MKFSTPNSAIEIYYGDITSLKVDAIVNAANKQLIPRSGVCGAIFRKSGMGLRSECQNIKFCETGSSVITNGYELHARFVIHSVGPVFHEEKEDAPKLLESAYASALELANLKNLESIAFPCLSTGVYGYPKPEASKIAIQTVIRFLDEPTSLKKVIFCCFEKTDLSLYLDFFKISPL